MRSGWSDALERTKERYFVLAIEVFERRRWTRTVRARQYFWMLLHDEYGWSFPEIAQHMPKQFNHTTVLSGVRKARKREADANAAPSGVHAAVEVQEETNVANG